MLQTFMMKAEKTIGYLVNLVVIQDEIPEIPHRIQLIVEVLELI